MRLKEGNRGIHLSNAQLYICSPRDIILVLDHNPPRTRTVPFNLLSMVLMHLIVLGMLLQVTKPERDAPMTSGLHPKDSQGGRGSVLVQP